MPHQLTKEDVVYLQSQILKLATNLVTGVQPKNVKVQVELEVAEDWKEMAGFIAAKNGQTFEQVLADWAKQGIADHLNGLMTNQKKRSTPKKKPKPHLKSVLANNSKATSLDMSALGSQMQDIQAFMTKFQQLETMLNGLGIETGINNPSK